MRFLGTGAAEAIPNPLCDCKLCRAARENPKNARMRSMFELDSENLIDFGPDFVASTIRFNLDYHNLQNVFITHTHEDHLHLSNSGLIDMSGTRKEIPIHVYLSEAGYTTMMERYEKIKETLPYREIVKCMNEGMVIPHPVFTGKPFQAGGYDILAVRTTHQSSPTETAINYRFTKDGKSLLYASDTGMYLPESVDLLRDSHLDILIMEGTWGSRTDKGTVSHMNGYSLLEQFEIFSKAGIIDSHTQIYITHINHHHDWTHEDYQAFMDKHAEQKVTIAYDGMEIKQ